MTGEAANGGESEGLLRWRNRNRLLEVLHRPQGPSRSRRAPRHLLVSACHFPAPAVQAAACHHPSNCGGGRVPPPSTGW